MNLNKILEFIKKHDWETTFVIPYVLISIYIAIYLNLVCFFIWILLHYILEILKRYFIFKKISLKDLVIALQHCKLDFMFFFVALFLESVVSIKFGVAPSVISTSRILTRLEKIINSIEILVRTLGFLKTSKGIYQILEFLKIKDSEIKYYILEMEHKELKLSFSDVWVFFIISLSFLISFIILYTALNGDISAIIKIYINTLFK